MSTHKLISLVKVACLGLLLVAALILAACGPEGASEPTPTATPPEVSQETPQPTPTEASRETSEATLTVTPPEASQETPQPTPTAAPTGAPQDTSLPLDEGMTRGPSKIAFVSNEDGNQEIYVMDADGSNPTRLTNNPDVDTQPNWSPDGAGLVFVSERDGNQEIYVMNADGSNPTRLTNNSDVDFLPAWSPDGTSIAFVSRI